MDGNGRQRIRLYVLLLPLLALAYDGINVLAFVCVEIVDSSFHHYHLSLDREGPWGTTDDFATSFLHFSLFSTALWNLPNSRPVHPLMLSSHCLPGLLPPFAVPCKMVLARPEERET